MRKLFVLFAAATMIAPAFAIDPATITVNVQVDAFSYVSIGALSNTIVVSHSDQSKQEGMAHGLVTSGSNNGGGYKVDLSLSGPPRGFVALTPQQYNAQTVNRMSINWYQLLTTEKSYSGPFNDSSGSRFDVWAYLGDNWIDAAAGTTAVTITATLTNF